MFKAKNYLIPDAFQNKFNMISHDYFIKTVCAILRNLSLA